MQLGFADMETLNDGDIINDETLGTVIGMNNGENLKFRPVLT